MTLIRKLLPTTVVGSYPVVRGKGLRTLFDPLSHAVETAVADQLEAGIDIISDGQVRGDMIGMITEAMPGIKHRDVTGTVRAPTKPITLADTRYALSRHSKVKGILTGPSTLAHGLRIATPAYRNKAELALDIAQALAVEARALEDAGVTIIQIDEPILSTGAADLHVAQHAVHTITSMLRVPTCLHVCGDLADAIDDLLRIRVNILDFEFANNPANRDLIGRKDLGERMLGYGVVDSSDPAVESVDVIEGRIRQAVDSFDPATLLIDPDCGLRMLTREAAFAKLRNMATAAARVRTGL
ncbi:MAG: methionine synthase [Methanomicrobiaceae archaeon]|nr:methionine synthase [Methanomicrobiaceae archaeon]